MACESSSSRFPLESPAFYKITSVELKTPAMGNTYKLSSSKVDTEKRGLFGSACRSASLTWTEYSDSSRIDPLNGLVAPSLWGMLAGLSFSVEAELDDSVGFVSVADLSEEAGLEVGGGIKRFSEVDSGAAVVIRSAKELSCEAITASSNFTRMREPRPRAQEELSRVQSSTELLNTVKMTTTQGGQ
jgi:hypothetical protein